jgi:hypothetical protein
MKTVSEQMLTLIQEMRQIVQQSSAQLEKLEQAQVHQ